MRRAEEPPLTEDGTRTRFVGREDELAILRTLLGRASRESSIQLVTVIGEPGVGTSRLIREFVDAAGENVRSYRGRSLPLGEGEPFAPLAEIVRSVVGVAESDRPGDVRRKLGTELEQLIADEPDRGWLASRLASLVGLARADGADAAVQREAFAAWQRFFEAEATRPIVLVFEDLHNAEPSLLAFLEHLLDWSTGAAILIACTARPELYVTRRGWGGGKRASLTIGLSPLSPAESGELVADLLDEVGLGASAGGLVVERAAGNPLYAEQFVRLLAERRDEPAGSSGAPDGIALPQTLREVVDARLDRLAPEQQEALRSGAVVGSSFWPGALVAMDGRDAATTLAILTELGRRELIRPGGPAPIAEEAGYTFQHALIRDVAYEGTPDNAKWAKHLAAARWLEEVASDRAGEHAEALANHYRRALALGRAAGAEPGALAEATEQAVRYLSTAGDRTTQLDVARADALYAEAFDLLAPDDPARADVSAKLASTAGLSGRFPDAVRLYGEAIAGLRSQDRPVDAARAELELAYVYWNKGGTALGREALGRAFELLQGHPPGRELAEALTYEAADLFFAGDSRGALARSDDAMRMANDVGATDLTARLLQVRGMSRCDLGDWGGLDDLHAALRACRQLGLGQETVRASLNLGTFVTPIDGPAAALRHYTAGAELAERRGLTDLGMWIGAWELGVLFELGHWDRVVEQADTVVAWDTARGGSMLRVAALNCKAEALVYRGHADIAAEMARAFVPMADAVGDPQILVPALAVAAIALSLAGDHEGAVQAIERGEIVGRERGMWVHTLFLQARVRAAVAAGRVDLAERLTDGIDASTPRSAHSLVTARATLAEAGGTWDEAAELYADAASRWRAYGFVLEEALAFAGLARSRRAQGRTAEATTPASRAAELLAALGASPSLAGG